MEFDVRMPSQPFIIAFVDAVNILAPLAGKRVETPDEVSAAATADNGESAENDVNVLMRSRVRK